MTDVPPVERRLRRWSIAVAAAIVPAVVVIALYGDRGTGPLIILSQVVLSLQLPFAVFPLVMFTSNKKLMGVLVNKRVTTIAASVVAALIVSLNLFLLYQIFFGG